MACLNWEGTSHNERPTAVFGRDNGAAGPD